MAIAIIQLLPQMDYYISFAPCKFISSYIFLRNDRHPYKMDLLEKWQSRSESFMAMVIMIVLITRENKNNKKKKKAGPRGFLEWNQDMFASSESVEPFFFYDSYVM